jgi:GH35 family endo-1,4-beta-xylanase
MKGIKLWGILDNVDRRSRQQLRPYLFDAEGRSKPAFYAVQQALAQKQGNTSQ